MIRTMTREYGTNPADVTAVIGPSICMDCYEVGEEVIREFEETYGPALAERMYYSKPDGKYQLNLWEACRQNFLRAGVREEHLSLPDVCTHCNPDYLFSHRTLHGRQGNLGAFIVIRDADME